MKYFLIIILMISGNIMSQELNKTIIDEKSGKEILIDEITTDKLKTDTLYNYWFNSNYEMYEVNDTLLQGLNLENITIKVILGTWCGDSKREFPRFVKILEYLKFDFNNLKVYAVDRKKKGVEINFDEYKVEKVPTFYFYRNNEEIGQIVETPQTSLEGDFAKIINNK